MKLRNISLVLVLGGSIGACSGDRNTTKLQYMPDMADAPTVKAQENYLDPPDHAVAVNAILYPADIAVAEKELKMPDFLSHPSRLEVNLAAGKKHFETFCSVCHGAAGRGKGTLGSSYPISVPDLTRPDLASRQDGFFFIKISKGGAMMPSYGHAISPNERWQIISYLRTLQKK